MTWWDNEFRNLPDRTWVYRGTYSGYMLPVGVHYWWYKIPADAHHKIQIARKFAENGKLIYIYTYPNDTPNWAGATLVEIGPPCSNWSSDVYMFTWFTRDQTWGLNAAIQAKREKPLGLLAVIALNPELSPKISATISADLVLDTGISAYISGNPERSIRMFAAICKGQELPLGLVSAIATQFDLPTGISATINGNPDKHCHIKAAIKGETETSVGIVAYVVKSRIDTILLEMENLFPQECDLRSTPNWRSKVKDWRKDTLGG